jgi:hypothetical protein
MVLAMVRFRTMPISLTYRSHNHLLVPRFHRTEMVHRDGHGRQFHRAIEYAKECWSIKIEPSLFFFNN